MTIHIQREKHGFSIEVYDGGYQLGESHLTADELIGVVSAKIWGVTHPFLRTPLERVQFVVRSYGLIGAFGNSPELQED